MDCKFVFETCSEFDTMSLGQNQHEAQMFHIIKLSAETKLTSLLPSQGDVTILQFCWIIVKFTISEIIVLIKYPWETSSFVRAKLLSRKPGFGETEESQSNLILQVLKAQSFPVLQIVMMMMIQSSKPHTSQDWRQILPLHCCQSNRPKTIWTFRSKVEILHEYFFQPARKACGPEGPARWER